jgi:hypothetical protein
MAKAADRAFTNELPDPMDRENVEPAGMVAGRLLGTSCLRHRSLCIGSKHPVLSVAVTVILRGALENFSSCAGLRFCAAIEWE